MGCNQQSRTTMKMCGFNLTILDSGPTEREKINHNNDSCGAPAHVGRWGKNEAAGGGALVLASG